MPAKGGLFFNPWATGGGVKASAASSPTSLVDLYSKMASEATAANKARETEIRGLYADIINSISGSNDSLRASGLKDIETQTNKLVGQETQNLISSGLYGTTTAAAVPRNVATEFAQPARLKLEDLISSRKREAQLGLAGFIERIQNSYPDYNALFQAEAAQASTPTVTTTINKGKSLQQFLNEMW